MKFLFLSILLLFISNVSSAEFGDVPIKKFGFNKDKKCYFYKDKLIYVFKNESKMEPYSTSFGYLDLSDQKPSKSLCEKLQKRIKIKTIENAEFLGIVGDLIIMKTYMSASGTGKILLYDLRKGVKIKSVF
ncbi:MAG: hypothetical protein KDD45_04935, partial [Bdellovibrionales bacterium]|nr:hypothetical protein [Bdellovibrionales bacterium]